ncbi:TIGR03643 family protein [Flavobacterium piscinae]|uniref:TIGR03643 family protein n=1 Tax=Flavobacterium piscinae TaxID=2506424 RepID=UPI0019965A6E|nr:TIGR03643 family protein [Flavobacterium piscinae]MBC8883111.1 TIGR03643 family protein [Flavobacterium piscinae]
MCFWTNEKSKRVELTHEEIERVISMAQEEKKPFEVLKVEFGISENEVTELMRKRLSKDNFELWKKKVTASKPKPKPIIDDFDDDLDSKYYIKNKFD